VEAHRYGIQDQAPQPIRMLIPLQPAIAPTPKTDEASMVSSRCMAITILETRHDAID